MELKFYRIVDRTPNNWEKSNNGGDYEEGRTIAVLDGKPVGVRFWSSWEGNYCHLCGNYTPFECNCGGPSPLPADYEDWESGTVLEDWAAELAQSRFDNGGFALVEP